MSLLIAAVGIPACGGDDEPATERSSQPTAATAATGPTAGAREPKPKRKRARAKQQRDPTGATQQSAPAEEEPPQLQPPPTTGGDNRDKIDRDYYDAAKRVCSALPIEKFARALGSERSDPDAVAKTYAKRYPADRRKAVEDGCRAGFRAAPGQ
jgi:hypothetical protein